MISGQATSYWCPNELGIHFNGFYYKAAYVKEFDSIFIVVDMLTKITYLFPVCNNYIAKDVAHMFVQGVILHHGLPRRVVLDHDSKFISIFWKALFKAPQTQSAYSIAYPRADGQIERVIK